MNGICPECRGNPCAPACSRRNRRAALSTKQEAGEVRFEQIVPDDPRAYVAVEAGEECGAGAAAFDDIEKAAMRLALKRCGEQFRFYEREHLAKAAASQWNGMTASAVASSNKAETNAAMAVMCEALLSQAGEVSRSQTAQALEEAARIAERYADDLNQFDYHSIHEGIVKPIRALSLPAPDAAKVEDGK